MLGRHIGRILEPLTSGEDLPGILNLLCKIVEDDLANKSVSVTIIMPDRSNGCVKVVAGLGLPLTKALTELHDGKLEIQSTPGEGTAVFITLPHWRMPPATTVQTASKKKSAPRKRA